MSAKIVDDDRIIKSVNKNTVYLKFKFQKPVVCKLDEYIKDSCMHKSMPSTNSKCDRCIKENPSCLMFHAMWHGGAVKVTPPSQAVIDDKFIERKKAKVQKWQEKKMKKDRIKKIRENGGKV